MTTVEEQPVKQAIFNLRTLAMIPDESVKKVFLNVKSAVPEILGKEYTFEQIQTGNSVELAKAEKDAITRDSIIKYNKLIQEAEIDVEYKNQLYIAEREQ